MYCPKCFNDTLKVASSGVVKLTFNGKAKATSQFYYNLAQDKKEEILKKLEDVIVDYFSYYFIIIFYTYRFFFKLTI